MRWVMNNNIDDGEIIWLHDYTQNQINKNPNNAWALLTPHPYMAYVTPNYNNPIFHDPANYEYFDNLFDGIFSKYGVPYSTSSQKQTMAKAIGVLIMMFLDGLNLKRAKDSLWDGEIMEVIKVITMFLIS